MLRTAQLTAENKINAVEILYKNLPIREEVSGVSYKQFGREAGLSDSQAQRLVESLEDCGILKRRTTMGYGGKKAYWTLMVDKAEAVSKLEETFTLRSNASLRNRILAALETHGPFETVHDILLFIAKPGESIDLHNITHLLKAMRQQGILNFKQSASGRRGRGKGNATANIPYNIMLGRNAPKPAMVALPEPEPEPTPEPEPEPTPITEAVEFPLIQRVVLRREFLERAALLAEQGGEYELSITLLEKAETSLTPIEQEMVSLWNAYQACKG